MGRTGGSIGAVRSGSAAGLGGYQSQRIGGGETTIRLNDRQLTWEHREILEDVAGIRRVTVPTSVYNRATGSYDLRPASTHPSSVVGKITPSQLSAEISKADQLIASGEFRRRREAARGRRGR